MSWAWAMRKDAGDANIISALICNVIGILVFVLMVFLMLDYSKVLDTKNSIYTICDAYLEQMMADGYLRPEKEQELKEELAPLGVHDLDCSRSTREEGQYGERIYLEVEFNLDVRLHRITEFMVAEAQDGQVHTAYKRAGTSYH